MLHYDEPEADEEVSYHSRGWRVNPTLSLVAVTHERCKLAHEMVALIYESAMSDLDTHEQLPAELLGVSQEATQILAMVRARYTLWYEERR
jgi:DUF1365 family protein